MAADVESIRKYWKLGAAAVVGSNWRIMQERVNSELEGLGKAESNVVLSKLGGQMEAAGVNLNDCYAAMKKRERKSRKMGIIS